MRKYFLPCLLLLLQSACMPMHVDMDLSACPSIGLQNVTFYDGPPATGTVITPVAAEDKMTWTFREGGQTYVSCHYDDGSAKIQKLPQEVRSCAESKKAPVTCKAVL